MAIEKASAGGGGGLTFRGWQDWRGGLDVINVTGLSQKNINQKFMS